MYTIFVLLLATAALALDTVRVPSTIAAGRSFQVTFANGNQNSYRVYLAANLTGVNGPTCYLENSTTLATPFDLSIIASVGPSADYYSIAIADLTADSALTYSNQFDFTAGTGVYSDYESQLGGAPFWDANDLPCTAYSCARSCATASYPEDLTETSAYNTMKACILQCSGVSPAPSQTAPAHLVTTAASTATTAANMALITLASGVVLTAIETTAISDGKTITEAILGGSDTIVLGGAATTLSGETVSLASDGVAVDGTTTLPFMSTTTTPTTATTTNPSVAASSSAAAVRRQVDIVVAVGFAGVGALMW